MGARRNRYRFDRIVILNGRSTSAMAYSKEKSAWERCAGGGRGIFKVA